MTRINMREAGLTRDKARKIGNNTWRHIDAEGVEHIRLHHTDIIDILAEGRYRLNSGGYQTVTTKDRLNKFLEDYRVYSNKGLWYVMSFGRSVPFEDGMILPDAFQNPSAHVSAGPPS